ISVNNSYLGGSIVAGSGNDYVYAYNSSGLSVDLGDGNNTGDFYYNSMSVTAGSGDDSLLFYGTYNGSVDAGAGNDTLTIQGSNMTLTGGAGGDIYRLSSGSTATITDFTAGAGGDVLDLTYLLQTIPAYPGGNPFAT